MRKILFITIALVIFVAACGTSFVYDEPAKTSTNKITVVSITPRYDGTRFEPVVHIRNNTSETAIGIKIYVDCINGGVVTRTEWAPSDPYDLGAGDESVRGVRFTGDEKCTCSQTKVRVTVRYWE